MYGIFYHWYSKIKDLTNAMPKESLLIKRLHCVNTQFSERIICLNNYLNYSFIAKTKKAFFKTRDVSYASSCHYCCYKNNDMRRKYKHFLSLRMSTLTADLISDFLGHDT